MSVCQPLLSQLPPLLPPLLQQDAPRIGALPSGPRDAITDVAGVRVGHATLASVVPSGSPGGSPVGSSAGKILQTGVTVVLPPDDPFLSRPLAACQVFNGFGKSVGLLQLTELGCLETPIALTNTLSVGTIATAQIRAALAAHPAIGRNWPTLNPLVLECNDGYLNDIQALAVTEAHYAVALADACADFAQGCVGAGRGMSCFQLKGGIGSASRMVTVATGTFTVGALVLANFGKMPQCILAGQAVGDTVQARLAELAQAGTEATAPEKGSIIMLLATDAPLDTLQLGRLARRAGNGLARAGSIFGHGSGDIAVAFTTANRLPWPEPDAAITLSRLPDGQLDPLFQATVDAVEQAIVHALYRAETVRGRDGHVRYALRDLVTMAGSEQK